MFARSMALRMSCGTSALLVVGTIAFIKMAPEQTVSVVWPETPVPTGTVGKAWKCSSSSELMDGKAYAEHKANTQRQVDSMLEAG